MPTGASLVTLRDITAATVRQIVGLGFRHTGRLDGNEIVLELPLR